MYVKLNLSSDIDWERLIKTLSMSTILRVPDVWNDRLLNIEETTTIDDKPLSVRLCLLN